MESARTCLRKGGRLRPNVGVGIKRFRDTGGQRINLDAGDRRTAEDFFRHQADEMTDSRTRPPWKESGSSALLLAGRLENVRAAQEKSSRSARARDDKTGKDKSFPAHKFLPLDPPGLRGVRRVRHKVAGHLARAIASTSTSVALDAKEAIPIPQSSAVARDLRALDWQIRKPSPASVERFEKG